jgi:hypothetical protein
MLYGIFRLQAQAIACICKREKKREIGMKRTRLTNTIAYRVSEDQWRRIQEEAEKDEVSIHDWCREAVLEKLQNLREATMEQGPRPPAEIGNGIAGGANELLLLEKISRLEYLIEHGFGIQHSTNRAHDEEWKKRIKDSKYSARILLQMALEGSSTRERNGEGVDRGRG